MLIIIFIFFNYENETLWHELFGKAAIKWVWVPFLGGTGRKIELKQEKRRISLGLEREFFNLYLTHCTTPFTFSDHILLFL